MAPRITGALQAFVLLFPALLAAETGDFRRLDPNVRAELETTGTAQALVLLRDRASLPTRHPGIEVRAHRRALVHALRETAAESQAELLAELDRRGVDYRAYWIVNMVRVSGREDDFEAVLARPEVDRVVADVKTRLRGPARIETMSSESISRAVVDAEPGLVQIDAPRLWEAGFLGRGITVGIADTGVEWHHPALRRAYAGWDGSSASHDYHWWDAVHSGGGSCGADSPEPCDDFAHGTHVAGIVLGDDGGPPGSRNRIGVAPEARWIGCRNMDRGVGSVASYAECLQFFLAPTDRSGGDPDPDRAPDVINNSWICEIDEGCDDPIVLQEAVEAVRAAGILFVSAAGNQGPLCGTLDRPPSIYAASLTVASVDSSDRVAVGSSRGPGPFADSIKPDLGAPGIGVRSALPGGRYGRLSGTSMAAPHVTGGASLLLSACPYLQSDPDAAASRLRASTIFRASSQECGGIPGDQRPNPITGWGSLRLPFPGPALCTPIVDGEPGALSLDRAVHTVREGSGEVVIPVVRSGGVTGTIAVDYATFDGTARAPGDYRSQAGSLVWGDGDSTHREISIEIVADSRAEVFETFRLALSDPTGGATVASPSETSVQIVETGSGGCVADATTLCLQDDRFEVRGAFRTVSGETGVAEVEELTPDTGTLWFFRPGNVEIVAKVLDGCRTPFESFWLYASGLTDQGVSLVVRDTAKDELRVYENPPGRPFVLIRDASSFRTCP